MIAFAVLCGAGVLLGLFTGTEEAMLAGVASLPNPRRKREIVDDEPLTDN